MPRFQHSTFYFATLVRVWLKAKQLKKTGAKVKVGLKRKKK